MESPKVTREEVLAMCFRVVFKAAKQRIETERCLEEAKRIEENWAKWTQRRLNEQKDNAPLFDYGDDVSDLNYLIEIDQLGKP